MQHRYAISGMHCPSCVAKITEALSAVPGVEAVDVTLTPPAAKVTMAHHVETARLQNAIAQRGEYVLSTLDTMTPPAPAARLNAEQPKPDSLYPLVLIVAYLLGVVVLIELVSADASWTRGMRHFMAGFFLVFSFFKLLNLSGFVSAYQGYDLLARRSQIWAWSYPFVELALGVMYLLNAWPIAVNLIVLALMLIGALGVTRALLDKKAIRCACLGTALNLPMTKVTLIEDLTMAGMAGVMLVMALVP